MVLNCAVQALAIAAYSARLAGARSGRVATAISLFNIFATTSRFAQMLYTPMLGALSDHAVPATLSTYEWQLRFIIFSGTAGAVIGTLAIPTFVMFYLRAIRSLERNGSIPKAALAIFRPATVAAVIGEVKFSMATRWRDISFKHVPKDILVLNVLVTAVYGAGIVAAAYASVLQPAAARTAVLSSGLRQRLRDDRLQHHRRSSLGAADRSRRSRRTLRRRRQRFGDRTLAHGNPRNALLAVAARSGRDLHRMGRETHQRPLEGACAY